jgi:hypothetical protein
MGIPVGTYLLSADAMVGINGNLHNALHDMRILFKRLDITVTSALKAW